MMDLAEGHRASFDYFRSENLQQLTVNLGCDNSASVFEVIRASEIANCCSIPYELVAQHLKWD